MEDIIPSHILQEAFPRPFDVKLSAKKMDEFIKMHGKHVKKKILVVDDSGAMLRNVKGWLEDKYQVILANSGFVRLRIKNEKNAKVGFKTKAIFMLNATKNKKKGTYDN